MKTIALAGNPNCGKTTLFNALTGSTAHVGNWPGVTVDKKKEFIRKRRSLFKSLTFQVFIRFLHILLRRLFQEIIFLMKSLHV